MAKLYGAALAEQIRAERQRILDAMERRETRIANGEGTDAFIGDVVADMYDPHTGLGVIEYDAESGIIRINFGDEESVHIGYLPEVLIVGNIHDEEYKKLIKKPDAAKPEKPTRPVPGLKLIKGGKK